MFIFAILKKTKTLYFVVYQYIKTTQKGNFYNLIVSTFRMNQKNN
jgi:hypothetical protein